MQDLDCTPSAQPAQEGQDPDKWVQDPGFTPMPSQPWRCRIRERGCRSWATHLHPASPGDAGTGLSPIPNWEGGAGPEE